MWDCKRGPGAPGQTQRLQPSSNRSAKIIAPGNEKSLPHFNRKFIILFILLIFLNHVSNLIANKASFDFEIFPAQESNNLGIDKNRWIPEKCRKTQSSDAAEDEIVWAGNSSLESRFNINYVFISKMKAYLSKQTFLAEK